MNFLDMLKINGTHERAVKINESVFDCEVVLCLEQYYRNMARLYQDRANEVASQSPRMAARIRDVSEAFSALATLCADIKRSER